MKAVILAGGLGTRLSEETDIKPKPMVEIGGKPILWHIMKIYSFYGIRDFIICLGYKGYVIKEFFRNYRLHMSDVTFNLGEGSSQILQTNTEAWNVTLIDTGELSMTGGRLLRVADHLRDEREFFFTYGDGLADVNLAELLNFHRSHGREATLTAVMPPSRYGVLRLSQNDEIISFQEKPDDSGSWINGGFFVLKPDVLNRIEGDATSWESGPLSDLAKSNQLMAFKHHGFWQPMDTLREKILLNSMWSEGKAPWKVWSK